MATVDGSACVLGLGRMGTAIARRLLEQKVPVTVWNRSPGPMRRLAAYGASTAPTPAAAARSADVVLVTVEDWSATRAVLLGPDGALTAGPLTGVLIATSTAAPEDLAVLAERTTAILDVGVLGGHRHAAAGRLQLYVGGRADVVARVQPWLNLLGRPVQHVGDLGGGVRLTLIMNFLVGVHVQVLAEAVALADGVDLDRRLLLDVITRNGLHHPLLGLTALRLSAEDYSAADFRLRLMAKELNLAVATARQAGVELPLAEAAQRAHDTALTLGLGDEDCAAIARVMSPTGQLRATVRHPHPTVTELNHGMPPRHTREFSPRRPPQATPGASPAGA